MLIFLPDKSGANPMHLKEAGLGHLLRSDDETPSATDLITAGPGGLFGQIWGWLGNGKESSGFLPEGQTWIPSDCGKYWVGWQYDFAPSSVTLARKVLVPGHVAALGDDLQPWLIPSAATLPQQAKFKGGEWKWQPQTKYAEFVERSAWAFDIARKLLEEGGTAPLETIPYALEVLGLNYRLVPEVVDHLGLFTPQALLLILTASTDVGKLQEIFHELKKAGPAVAPSG